MAPPPACRRRKIPLVRRRIPALTMNRRDILKLAALAPGLLAWPRQAFSAINAAGLKPGETFSHDALVAYARDLAKTPYQAPDATLPAPFQDLDYEHYVAIRFRPERAVWSAEQRGF